jgi:hypothetical protein
MNTASIRKQQSCGWLTVAEDAPVKYDPLPWQIRGLRETASGYGRKLTTEYKVFFCGRWRRVYCCQFSNAGVLYFQSRGVVHTVS